MRAFALALTSLTLTAVSAGAQVASFSTSDDTIMPNPRTVFISKANLPGDGLVIVRSVRGGSIQPASLGLAAVGPGETTNIVVRLKRPAKAGDELIVMLHADTGRKGIYDGDPTVLSVDISNAVVRKAVGHR